MIVELTGDADTLNSFIELYNPYQVLKNFARTGAMAMKIRAAYPRLVKVRDLLRSRWIKYTMPHMF